MSRDVVKWLQKLGLDEYVALFADNAIDGEVLPELSDTDLEKIGVKLGHRKKLLKAIAALEGTPSPGDESDTSEGATQAERRHLTVMFCDLVGSTTLSERIDPEELREIIGNFHQACAIAIESFDGFIARYMGDGLLVYFGYPKAHEDDAERAVRAGLQIVASVGGLPTPDGSQLQVRVGIATGLVVAGDIIGEGASQERVALGDTPNLAARLQGLAAPDSVVIADDTQQLIEGLFVVRSLGPQRLKGISQPVSAYQVDRESEAPSRFEAVAERGLVKLLGRDSEIGLLLDRWNHARDGEGQLLLLSGEPGIGKSRIVTALRERIAPEPHNRVLYYCSPYHQNSALYPAIHQLERALRFTREDDAAQRLDKLDKVIRGLDVPAEQIVPLLASLLSLPATDSDALAQLTPERLKSKILDACVDIIAAMAEQQPVLMVVEDAHWIDPSTLELLNLVIDHLNRSRVFVVVTFRPEFEQPWSGHGQVTALALNRLGGRACSAIVDEVCGGRRLPAEVLDQIVEKTDGVPLYVEEMTKTILESGWLREVDGKYVVSGALPSFSIPASLQDSLMARLDRLAPVKAIAQLAAAIGRTFSHELMLAVCECSAEELEHGLDELARAELIYRRGRAPDIVYEFKHALVQDIAYQSLLKSTRRSYHRRIADQLLEKFSDTATTQPELLAHHYGEAQLFEQAIEYWRRAGLRASERSANVEAASHLGRGIELLDQLPESDQRNDLELHMLLALGAPLTTVKGYSAPEVGHVFRRARELCLSMPANPEHFPVMRGLWRYYQSGSDLREAVGLANECLQLAQDSGSSSLRLAAHTIMGITFYHSGELTLAREHFEAGIAIYDPANHQSLALLYGEDQGVVCLSRVPHVLWALGYPDQAMGVYRRSLALAEDLAHPYSLTYALIFGSRFCQLGREWNSAREHADHALALATEHGFALWAATARLFKGAALAMQGQEEEGLVQSERAVSALRSTGLEVGLPWFLSLLGFVYGRCGRATKGLAALDESLAIARKHNAFWYVPEIHRMRGELLLDQSGSDGQLVEACFRDALDAAREQQAKMLELRAAICLARLWHRDGKGAAARDLLRPVYDWFTEGAETIDLRDAKSLLNELQA